MLDNPLPSIVFLKTIFWIVISHNFSDWQLRLQGRYWVTNIPRCFPSNQRDILAIPPYRCLVIIAEEEQILIFYVSWTESRGYFCRLKCIIIKQHMHKLPKLQPHAASQTEIFCYNRFSLIPRPVKTGKLQGFKINFPILK